MMKLDETSLAGVLRHIGEWHLGYHELVALRGRLIKAHDWQRGQLEAGEIQTVAPVNFLALAALDWLEGDGSLAALMAMSDADLVILAGKARDRRTVKKPRRRRTQIKE